MVSQATVQAKVDHGFAIAASKLGVACDWYRPTGADNPLAVSNFLGGLQALLDTNASLRLRSPRQRQKPEEWYGAFDTSGVEIGDYLVTPDDETYFITVLDAFSPARLVLCNKVVTITVPGSIANLGLNPGYGGDNRADEVVVATAWPASVIKGPRGDAGDVRLPGDTKLPWEEILLPAIPGATLRNDMIVTYQDGNDTFRQILSMVELTSLGYRCTTLLETT